MKAEAALHRSGLDACIVSGLGGKTKTLNVSYMFTDSQEGNHALAVKAAWAYGFFIG